MGKHSHRFVDEFDGFIGFGLDRKSNENTMIYYLQKFSDDELIDMLKGRLSDFEIENIFNLISSILKKHMTEYEYHKFFLRDKI